MRQLELFHAQERSRDFWEMSREGVSEAAALLIELLREGADTVTFGAVVKRRMNLGGDTVPDAMARIYVDAVEAVTEERLRIKEAVEDAGEFRLCIVDSDNQSVLRGGAAFGFGRRDSNAGKTDSRYQAEMTVAKLTKIGQRKVAGGQADVSDMERVITAVKGAFLGQ